MMEGNDQIVISVIALLSQMMTREGDDELGHDVGDRRIADHGVMMMVLVSVDVADGDDDDDKKGRTMMRT